MMESSEDITRRILVVEDDEGLRRLILKALAKAGFDAQGVPTGAEALERVAGDPELILLLDQRLPDMEGSDIVMALKERGFRVPFIFMTGRGDERFAVEMMKLGAADYLVKSIDLIDLLPSALQRLFRELDAERRVEAAEQALRENEARQRAMVANISDVIAIVDAGGINRYKSPNVRYLFGWAPEELVGRSTFDCVHPDDQGEMREFFGKLLLEPDSTGNSECRYMCKDGSFKWIEFTAANLLDNPTIHGVLLNYRDISERKRTDAQLRQNLEEKEALLREVHHRVKNNLNVISSLLSLQSSVIKTPEQAIEAFRISRDRIMAMSIVHEELYHSSDYARVDMASFLDKLSRQLQPTQAFNEGVRLETRAEGITLSVNSSIPCGLILTELITNAYRHAFPKGGPGEIRVAMRRAEDDLIELCVSDNGIGLDEPPGLAYGTEERESSALGLTLVRLLVEQLEGTMTIGSEKGTHIRIRFPESNGEHP